jgi:acetylornithine deacetylase/succinyl-diaminopimelate desuccinylase-like protein
MSSVDSAIAHARDHHSAALDDLQTLVRIPSISTLSEHQGDMRRAAEWIGDQLRANGFENVDLLPTPKHPVVVGESLKAGAHAPTLLVYGHYDVQPVDPLDLWVSDPFGAEIRGENLYARGASDMKGQLVGLLKAIEALTRTGALPVNMRFLVEGEEEIGSPNLEAFMRQHKDRLACDLCLNVDSGILAADTPSITYALRGLSYLEIRLQGPATDLHSGMFGGAVPNPALVLCQLIAGLMGPLGKVSLPGFYDSVRPLSPEERDDLGRIPTPDEWWLEQSGSPALGGEEGYSATERVTARPSLDVNGLLSGFTGEGSKTVLPAKAMAKVSMRLVPDQTPEDVRRTMMAYLEANVPPGIRWELVEHSSCKPAIVERDSAAVQTASRALQTVWGRAPLFGRQGGSIPVVALLQDLLGAEVLMLGFGLADDNLHAPNEKQHLPTFYRGIETYIRFLSEYAGESAGSGLR